MKVSSSFAFLLLPVVFFAANAEENSIRKHDGATVESDTKRVLKGGHSSAFGSGSRKNRVLQKKSGNKGTACGACISACAQAPPKLTDGPQDCNDRCADACRGEGNTRK